LLFQAVPLPRLKRVLFLKRLAESTKQQIKSVRMFVVVFGMLCLCWFPYFSFVWYTERDTLNSHKHEYISLYLAFLNSGMNPLAYFTVDRHLRRALFALLGCRCFASEWKASLLADLKEAAKDCRRQQRYGIHHADETWMFSDTGLTDIIEQEIINRQKVEDYSSEEGRSSPSDDLHFGQASFSSLKELHNLVKPLSSQSSAKKRWQQVKSRTQLRHAGLQSKESWLFGVTRYLKSFRVLSEPSVADGNQPVVEGKKVEPDRWSEGSHGVDNENCLNQAAADTTQPAHTTSKQLKSQTTSNRTLRPDLKMIPGVHRAISKLSSKFRGARSKDKVKGAVVAKGSDEKGPATTAQSKESEMSISGEPSAFSTAYSAGQSRYTTFSDARSGLSCFSTTDRSQSFWKKAFAHHKPKTSEEVEAHLEKTMKRYCKVSRPPKISMVGSGRKNTREENEPVDKDLEELRARASLLHTASGRFILDQDRPSSSGRKWTLTEPQLAGHSGSGYRSRGLGRQSTLTEPQLAGHSGSGYRSRGLRRQSTLTEPQVVAHIESKDYFKVPSRKSTLTKSLVALHTELQYRSWIPGWKSTLTEPTPVPGRTESVDLFGVSTRKSDDFFSVSTKKSGEAFGLSAKKSGDVSALPHQKQSSNDASEPAENAVDALYSNAVPDETGTGVKAGTQQKSLADVLIVDELQDRDTELEKIKH
jgi:hypothetical protein